MPHTRTARVKPTRKARPPRTAPGRSLAQAGRRAYRATRAAPWQVQLLVAAVLAAAVFLMVNWVYQVIRKPAEMFFPVSGVLDKTPTETWRKYGPLFRGHATSVITPELLAALAQVESAGNPVARTYWRLEPARNPFDVYKPASSAVGMFQITDGTFREARRYCIHDHAVVGDGPWHDFKTCWFNGLYTRTLPSHAIEMTSALLDRAVANTMARQPAITATLREKQDLAAVIHLCGAGAANVYMRRGFRFPAGRRCGDHNVADYLARVNKLKERFTLLAAAEER